MLAALSACNHKASSAQRPTRSKGARRCPGRGAATFSGSVAMGCWSYTNTSEVKPASTKACAPADSRNETSRGRGATRNTWAAGAGARQACASAVSSAALPSSSQGATMLRRSAMPCAAALRATASNTLAASCAKTSLGGMSCDSSACASASASTGNHCAGTSSCGWADTTATPGTQSSARKRCSGRTSTAPAASSLCIQSGRTRA